MRTMGGRVEETGSTADGTPDLTDLPAAPRSALRPRTLLLVAVGLTAFALNLLALAGGDDGPLFWAAARTIPGGTAIASSDLVAVRVDGASGEGLIAADEAIVGSTAAVDLPVGSLLRPTDLHDGLADRSPTMAIAIAADRAVDGALAAGDRVDVVSVDRDGVAAFVARRLLVVRGPDAAPDRFGRAADPAVLVAVDDEQALAVAAALADGEVFLVLSESR